MRDPEVEQFLAHTRLASEEDAKADFERRVDRMREVLLRAETKGDAEGHPFHGNRYTGAIGDGEKPPPTGAGGTIVTKAGDRFYHVAPEGVRATIQKHGLDFRRGEVRFQGIEHPTGNYVFTTQDAAEEFARVQERLEADEYGDEAQSFDIWEVSPPAGTILHSDPFSDDESGLGKYSAFTVEPLPVKLLKSAPTGETKYSDDEPRDDHGRWGGGDPAVGTKVGQADGKDLHFAGWHLTDDAHLQETLDFQRGNGVRRHGGYLFTTDRAGAEKWNTSWTGERKYAAEILATKNHLGGEPWAETSASHPPGFNEWQVESRYARVGRVIPAHELAKK